MSKLRSIAELRAFYGTVSIGKCENAAMKSFVFCNVEHDGPKLE